MDLRARSRKLQEFELHAPADRADPRSKQGEDILVDLGEA
jgi:hypothetical protein